MDKIMDKQWPELLGVDINYAKEEILRTNPGLQVEFVPQGSMTIEDERWDRVWVFHNAENKVVSIPRVG